VSNEAPVKHWIECEALYMEQVELGNGKEQWQKCEILNVKMKIEKQDCDGINFMMVYPRYYRVI
jgi:hypothetical protein